MRINKGINNYIQKIYPEVANNFESESESESQSEDYSIIEKNVKKEIYKKNNKQHKTQELSFRINSDENQNLHGGGMMIDYTEIKDKPNGGFPPIYLLSKNDIDKFTINKREFATVKNSISIKDILKNRKLI
jgi:hypothetical protein